MTDTKHWLGIEGETCVVTGAAGGIGSATARGLAQAGARVALLDRDIAGCEKLAAELAASGATALAVECDVASEESVRAAARRVEAELGAVYALVNNAGALKAAPLSEVSLEDWNRVLAVNLTGYLLCARAFSTGMFDAARGSIVHVASIAGLFPQTNSGAYSASKAGVVLMARQLAVEWGSRGVRSNSICPGLIKTPLSAAFYAVPGVEQKRAEVTASRRVGLPEDIANAAMFLASPRSSYVNAAEIVVDGGLKSMLMDMVPRPGFNS
ncbi:2-(S)-hydroxypropyl-CoM dehydrogenase [Variovorax sp. PBS-H4]|uniref:SDR family NAD(P)-dependent oxidoreductase n=1 Tax=Variovorax sp. PBS-H4 TaxID=434008 RepID=UPI0013160B5B|nr:SDR family oxidoreductase [Variovorax sp. PBS-H4]VTU36485.1 2-(S)-hydroxypropyl-CoM dehydrogenase [Variovorax sp. PBS-H4]